MPDVDITEGESPKPQAEKLTPLQIAALDALLGVVDDEIRRRAHSLRPRPPEIEGSKSC
jgi:hypothetical protein